MIKNIKRVGIIFLAVAIVCLMAIGCLSANYVASSGSNFSNDSVKLDSSVNSFEQYSSETEIPEISEEILIVGNSCQELSAKWTEAVEKSLTGKHILATLNANWVGDAENGFRSTATGFKNQIIYVPTGAVITLDLNGYKISRGMHIFKDNGGIFIIEGGTLIIKDSSYDSELFFDAYNSSYQGKVDLERIPCGRIEGGRNNTSGGAISIYNGRLVFESGMIYNNKSSEYGGAIFANNKSFIEMKNGIINNNTSNGVNGIGGGGAIYLTNECTLNIYNGIIHKNSATFLMNDDGGAILVTNASVCNINDGIFSKNTAEDAGGFAVLRSGVMNILGGRFEYNFARNDGGVLYNPGGTTYIANATFVNNSTDGYGGAFNFSLGSSTAAIATIKDSVITGNTAVLYGGGITGGVRLSIGKNVQIYGNFVQGEPSDLHLYKNTTVNIVENLENSKIGIDFDSGHSGIFADDYTAYNIVTPYNHFYSNNYTSLAIVKDNAVSFEKTISSGVYDFIYLENGKRTNYKDKDLIHTTNDFDLRQNVNGGKLVLGGVITNTSVNEFLQNLNFEGNTLKLFDGANNLIYDYSNMQTGYNSLFDDSDRLSVGTGWKIEVYSITNHKVEEIYISVLGDLTGDGKINSADVNYLRRIVNDKEMYNILASKPYIQLATLLIKSSTLLDSDADILWGIVCGTSKIEYFM